MGVCVRGMGVCVRVIGWLVLERGVACYAMDAVVIAMK